MKEPGEVPSVPEPANSNVQMRLSIWQMLKGFGLKRLFLICVAVGAGLGIGIVATVASVTWFFSRPIPARDWPRLEIESAGLKAKLRTDWNDSVRYQLVVTSRSDDLKAAFDDKVRSHRASISFTVHLYDKAGFELCKKDVKPTPFVDSVGRIDGLHANDTFYSFECSRSNYKVADHWSLGYVFPSLTSGAASASISVPANNSATAKAVVAPTRLPEDSPSEGDDTLTGFDYLNGHLETLSGNTFVVRSGEQGIAHMWAIKVQVEGGKQPSLHITCKTKTDCVIENTTNHQAVHGRKIG